MIDECEWVGSGFDECARRARYTVTLRSKGYLGTRTVVACGRHVTAMVRQQLDDAEIGEPVTVTRRR